MRSPFPGMDPFIEACGLWEDFHHHLIERIFDHLAAAAPPEYLVRTGERSYVVRGVAAVADPARGTAAGRKSAFGGMNDRETFVEIYEADPEQRLVTCIEVLSPSNKRPGTRGWELYQRKRQALLLGAANLVEIDLVREGQKMPMLDPWPSAPYSLLVCRKSRAPYCKVWPARVQKPVPVIPVPLAGADADVPLALQPMIETIYDRARYHRSIDYSRPLTPPLSAEELACLAGQLRSPPPAS